MLRQAVVSRRALLYYMSVAARVTNRPDRLLGFLQGTQPLAA